MTAEMLGEAISEYGRTLCVLESCPQDVDIVQIEGGPCKAWSVWVPLRTLEEGKSDLTLLLRLLENEASDIEVQIDDLRVL